VLLRIDDIHVHQRRVQRRRLLHQRVYEWGQRVRDDQQYANSNLCGRGQRMHGADHVRVRVSAGVRTLWFSVLRRSQLGGVADDR